MTRAWDGHTSTALGAKAHTDHLARGPSKSWVVAQILKTGAANTLLGVDARLFCGIQSVGNVSYTGGTCTDLGIGACGIAPTVDFTHAETGVRTFTIDTPYIDSFLDVLDTQHDPSTSGLWTYKDQTTTPNRCYAYYRMASNPEFGFSLRIPYDTLDPILYFGCTVNAGQEADRVTGVPACASTWSVEPPASLVYRDVANAAAVCYQIHKRTAEGETWTPVDAPWERWPNAALYGMWGINQTTGKIWAKTDTNELSLWDIETGYSAASVQTVTLPASTVFSVRQWGAHTLVTGNDSNLYVYEGTTYHGTIGAPFNSATWDWSYFGYGWLVVTQDGDLHFWKFPTTGAPEFVQTLEYDPDVGAYSTAELVGDDHGVSGTYTRFFYDHTLGEWVDGGQMSHVRALSADGWTWGASIHRHQMLYRETEGDASRWDYRYVQVF
jgi:hypothetical protein